MSMFLQFDNEYLTTKNCGVRIMEQKRAGCNDRAQLREKTVMRHFYPIVLFSKFFISGGSRRRCLLSAGMIALFASAMPAAAQQSVPCASPPPATPALTISPQMFNDVCIPAGFGGNPIAYFDDFSWRAFLALVWPAQQDQRGKPDTALAPGAAGKPTVFETFKADWEIFQPNGQDPAPNWKDYSGDNPCGVANVVFGDVMLASFSKFSNLGMAGFGPKLTGALVAQNGTYVRYAVNFNESEFTTIMAKKAYLRASLANPVSFDSGAIDTKAAWIDMKGVANPGRYYTRQAMLFDLEANACTKTTVGLVGFHIVVKTASRPQWIWTSFEHIDNVPSAGAPGPFTFNNGSGTPMPSANPIPFPIPLKAPPPYNVERQKPIHASTATTNTKYRDALKAAGSPFQFYQLVMTQWPRDANSPQQAGSPNFTFPGVAPPGFPPPPFDATAFSNTTLETFEQKEIARGCMNCHNLTRSKTDFLWSVMTRAHPSILQIPAAPPPAPLAMRLSGQAAPAPNAVTQGLPPDQAEAFEALKGLLEIKPGK